MNRAKKLITSFLIFILASCSPAAVATDESHGVVTVRTDKASYSSDEAVTVTITNELNEAIEHYGTCSLTFCQVANDEWVCAVKDCHAPMELLMPASSVQFSEVSADTGNKTFRYQFEYFLPSSESLYIVYSNEFFIKP